MNNNDTFQHLLFLTGFSRNNELLIELFKAKGFEVTSSQIRRWRRNRLSLKSSPIPHSILLAFFEILFERKRQDPSFCQYVEMTENQPKIESENSESQN